MRQVITVFTFIMIFAVGSFSEVYDSLALRIIESSGQRSENIGFVVRKIGDTNRIVSINGDKKFIPASLQKLFTAAVAFDKLGTNYRAKTLIYADDFDRAAGIISGDLYIVGAGDAGFSAERLWLLAKHLRHLGVREIKGNLVIDNSYFSEEELVPGYGENKNSRAYMAPISAFAVSFNATSVVVSPSSPGQDAHISLFPPRDDVPMTGTVTTAEKGREFSVGTKKHDENGMEVMLSGVVKPSSAPKYVYRQVWEPVINAAQTFRAVAKESGITADFDVMLGKVNTAKSELILSFDSEPLTESINSMFKYSSNFTAEMIFLTLSAEILKEPASFASASGLVENWWKENFVENGEIFVINGSGMSVKTQLANQASAGQITDLLCWSAEQNWFYEYITAMSVAGIDGTLSTRFKNSNLKGNLRAKTGTLNDLGVSGLAGYFKADGEQYCVTFIANDLTTAQFAKWVLSEDLILGIKKAIEKTGK